MNPSPANRLLTSWYWIRIGLVRLACFLAGMSPRSMRADDEAEYPVWDFPDRVSDLAYEPQSGHLAIVGPWAQAVGVVDLDEQVGKPNLPDQLTQIAIQGKPTSVAWSPLEGVPKWVIGQRSPHALQIVDVDSRKIDKTLRLGTAYPLLVSRSHEPQSPLVLAYLQGTERDGENTTIDLKTGEQKKLSSFGVWRLATDCQCVFSGSDRQFVTNHPALAMNRRSSREDMVFVLTPWSDQVVFGNTVLSKQTSRDLNFEPWVFLEGPWCAGFDRQELVVGSALDSKEVARLRLPDDWIPQENRQQFQVPGILSREGLPSLFLFSDPTRKILIAASNHKLAILPWGHLPFPQDSNLTLKSPPANEAQVGVEYIVPLQTVAGQPQFELQQAPSGMTCLDRELRWTPRFDQVGEVPVRLKITEKNRTFWETWKIQVRQRRLNAPFVVRKASVSEDGQWAVVWGGKNQIDSKQLAVFDLTTEKLVREVTRPFAIEDAVITRDAIVLSEKRDVADSLARMPLVKLSRETLAVEHQAFVTPGSLIAMGSTQVFVVGPEPGPGITANRVDLSRVQMEDFSENVSLATHESVQRTAEGWIHSGALWSSDGQRPQLLLASNERDYSYGAGMLEIERGYLPFPLTSDLNVARVPDSRISPFGHQLRLINEHGGVKDTLAIGDQHDLRHVQNALLFPPGEQSLGHREAVQLGYFSQQVLAVYGGVAFVIPLPKLKVPVRLLRKQSTLTLNPTGKTTLQYEAEGASRYEIRFPFPDNTTYESQSGTFEIDAKELFGDRWKPTTEPTTMAIPDPKIAEWFRRLVGHAPGANLIQLTAIVTAYGPGLAKDSMEHAYFIDFPKGRAPR